MVVRQKKGGAIGRSRLEGLRGKLATGPSLVVHNHRCAQLVLEFVGQQAGNGVGAAARREAHHQLDAAGLRLHQA